MTDDFFRSRLDQMIDNAHPLAVLASRLPWDKMKSGAAPQFAHQARPLQQSEEAPDLAGDVVKISGFKASNAGRPRLAMRWWTSKPGDELAKINPSYTTAKGEKVVVWCPMPKT